LSHLNLATLLNALARNRQTLVSEGELTLSASSLSANVAIELAEATVAAGWPLSIFDQQGNEYELNEVEDDFAPFRLELQKSVSSANGDLFLVTEAGFKKYLEKGHASTTWRLLGLSHPFCCRSRAFLRWEDELSFEVGLPSKPPRLLVKESSSVRTVPEDVLPWLLLDGQMLDAANPFHALWMVHAFDALSRCIANEIDPSGSTLLFKGPPKLKLAFDPSLKIDASPITLERLLILQEAAGWVYDNPREAETKHILLSAEIARSGRADGEVVSYFGEHLEAALESAKIAYQMAISDIAKDTLKSLGDLRKAVTDETSKATDATRQAVTAIATALTVGLGIVAARLSVQINPYLITAAVLVAFTYTLISVFSGWKFIRIQHALREEWQPKLYRFLAAAEFDKMVRRPIARAERVFNGVAVVGLAVLLSMVIAVSHFAFTRVDPPLSGKDDGATPLQSPSSSPASSAPKQQESEGNRSREEQPDGWPSLITASL